MFEQCVPARPVSKDEYKREEAALRVDLINAQYDLRLEPFPVLLLVNGDFQGGCDDVVDLLHEWMDARYMLTSVFESPTDEESQRPRFWRYWRALPPDGRIGVFLGAWTLRAIADRALGHCDDADFARRIDHVRRFERMLVEDGALVLKFWIHAPDRRTPEGRKKRKRAPDWRIYDDPEAAGPFAERYVRETSTALAPWLLVDGSDERHRDLVVMRTMRDALRARLDEPHEPATSPAVPVPGDALADVDRTARLEDDEYDRRLPAAQGKLAKRVRKARKHGLTTVLAFEGRDAAGKGGVIRRITRPLHARDYTLVPIGAPTDEERAHHYLWRFWRHLPRAGRVLVFDRSWYGRVLVERVEGYATEAEWRRAYEEINDFEAQLVEHGIALVKFWLQIDPEEQLRRFRAREQTPYKKYKITDEDYRNRGQWDAYTEAVDEMLLRTSPSTAPWHVVSANDKRHARVTVLETVNDTLKAALKARD